MLTLAISSDEEVERSWKCNVSILGECLLFQEFDVGLGNSGLCGNSFGGRAAISDDEVLLLLGE